MTAAAGVLAGCASPGPPQPPSLHLPEPVTDLQVRRIGSSLELQWTTPSQSTDDLPLKGVLSAEICTGSTLKQDACQPVLKLSVHPGPSQATLPVEAAGAPSLLVVRLRVLNSAGKAAGWSAPAFTAAGSAPPPVDALRATAVEGGARLEWARVPGGPPVLLHRTLLTPAAPPHSREIVADADLEAADRQHTDPGGVLDRTTLEDHAYRYTALRKQTVTIDGHTVELLSTLSSPVTVQIHDVFPPAAPVGLATIPGTPDSAAPSIELSWAPNTEPDLAGYWVERAEAPPEVAMANLHWTRLTPQLLGIPAYRDSSVLARHRYLYRVLAVDTTGNTSAPSTVAEETAAPAEKP